MNSRNDCTRWDFSEGSLPFRDQLYKTALRLTHSAEEAEDLLQETFLKAFKYYDHFEDGTNLKAWLFRIMKNTFINTIRRNNGKPYHVDFDSVAEIVDKAVSMDPQAIDDTPESDLMHLEIDDEIGRALDQLPYNYKMAVLLVDLQGHTYQEVADLLAVPVGTIMSRLYRGRKKLEHALLLYGKRNHYLSSPPAKIRDEHLEPDAFFDR